MSRDATWQLEWLEYDLYDTPSQDPLSRKILLIHLHICSAIAWRFLECSIFGTGQPWSFKEPRFILSVGAVCLRSATWLNLVELDSAGPEETLKEVPAILHRSWLRWLSDAEDCGCSGDMFSFHSGPLGWKENEKPWNAISSALAPWNTLSIMLIMMRLV